MSALTQKLAAALASREDRNIRRRLPSPSLALPPPTPDSSSDASTPAISITTPEAAAAAAAESPATAAVGTSSDKLIRPPRAAPVDFSSNDYLSLSSSPILRAR